MRPPAPARPELPLLHPTYARNVSDA
jgi:hypothetical protein